MQVLLLSKGDAAAKDLLRKALAARYGVGAPALDTLKLTLRGRARFAVARLHTWVPLEAAAYFQFPLRARWEFSMRPIGLPISAGMHGFDGEIYRRKQGDQIEIVSSPDIHTAMRDQVWASALMLLTPMSELDVEIKREDEYSLFVRRMDTGSCVSLFLRHDYTLDRLEFPSLDPETGEKRLYRMTFDQQQVDVDGLVLPRVITMLWGDEIQYELAPVTTEINPTFDDTLFRLADSH